jgi:hypothetical protein
MRTPIRTPFQLRAAALVLLLVGSVAAVAAIASGCVHSSAAPNAWTPLPLTAVTTSNAEDDGRFRLGDAGRPFGWATAVGDFNTDGKADVAIADHVRSRSGQYAYRIEFAVSGQNPSRVTFESTQDALAINLADVDRDNDLDVVVRAAVSGETVGVWLNDGRGHFTAGDVHQVAATLAPAASVKTTDPAGDGAAFEPSPRRVVAEPSTRDGSPIAAPAVDFVRNSAHRSPSSFHTRRQNPRAPPASLPALLN